MRQKLEGVGFIAGYAACIPLANWAVENVGSCSSNGPCLVPVGLGLLAPSGVLFVGLSLVLRDMVQRRMGKAVAVLAMGMGALLSALLSPAHLVVASGSAFLLSEFADFAVYTPLQRRGLVTAVLASSLVGLVVDSVLFLQLAFGGLDFLAGQVVGKLWMVLASLPAVEWLRRRDAQLGLHLG